MENNMRGMRPPYRPSWIDKKTGQKREAPIWWIVYSAKGKVHRESSHSTKEADAWKLLKKRHGEIALNKLVGPDIQKTSFDNLTSMLTADYKANSRKSLARVEDAINHLRGFFGADKAIEITSDRVTEYIAHRQDEKAAASTINNELAALGRMFTLAIRAGKAASKPHITKLVMNNTRTGFLEIEQFNSILEHMPEDLKPMLETAYITGWRINSEVITRQKHHVDLKAGWLRLEPGETKNRKGRMFPLTPRLRSILEQQLARTDAIQRATGKIIPWLFHRDGERIKTFRRSWITGCIKAGLGIQITDSTGKMVKRVAHRVPHDFRRTAVRNLERAGVPRSAAMEMVGHKTMSIYSRYAICDESMLKEAGEKLEILYRADRQQTN
jgi:integrase